MSWIKRNLYFVLGSLVAVVLMVAGGFYLYSKISNTEAITEEIGKQYVELGRLNNLNPHPGSGKIDNVKAAKEQEQALHAYIGKSRQLFKRIAPIPDMPKVANADFAAQLRNTIVQLRREAEQASVQLPRDYYFTFEAERRLMVFESGSPDRLAVHLGEIKAIAEVLFDAKINSLDVVRREQVSVNDDKNPADYLSRKTVSTPLADITPYEFTFRCFSSELAGVLAGLANSPHGFIVKSINVDPAAPVATSPDAIPGSAAAVAPAPFYPPPQSAVAEASRRYGVGAIGTQPFVTPAAAPVATGPANRPGAMTIFLNEKPLRITLMVDVVKIKSATK
ncbi:MAG: hypothetical protein JWQ71_4895 [Pedosphaera sp.]|nr:hypothetical protein [Pedosphaera sp.]